jgi:purine-binding chemotaxis protein CheW
MELVLRNYNFTGEGLPLSILYASVLERDYIAVIFGIKEEIVKEVKPNSLLEEEIVGDALIKQRDKKIGHVPDIHMDWDAYLLEDEEEKDPPAKTNKKKIPVGHDETESPRQTENQFLTFSIKDDAYGITVEQIDKIVPLEEIAPLPYLPYEKDSIKGILNVQGEILPVYDFRMKMKLAESAYGKETLILIVMFRDDDNCDKKAGIIVDSVSGIIPMKPEEITKIHRVKRIPSKYIAGMGKTQGKSITLLELKEILS